MLEQYSRLKDCPNYAVSNFGNVLNIKTQYMLSPFVERKYLYVSFNLKKFRVHRLVAQAFLDNENNYKEIDHINNDTLNNRLDNLRWANRSMNSRNRKNRGHIQKSRICNSWNVMIQTRGERYTKSFKTFEEADKHLKEKILELDNDIY